MDMELLKFSFLYGGGLIGFPLCVLIWIPDVPTKNKKRIAFNLVVNLFIIISFTFILYGLYI